MLECRTDLIERYNNSFDESVEQDTVLTVQALKKVVEVYNELKNMVQNVRATYSTGDNQMEFLLNTIHRTTYFDKVNEVDFDMVDVFYFEPNVNKNEVDEVILTVTIDDNQLRLAECIEFGIRGDDYPIDTDIKDIEHTIFLHK